MCKNIAFLPQELPLTAEYFVWDFSACRRENALRSVNSCVVAFSDMWFCPLVSCSIRAFSRANRLDA